MNSSANQKFSVTMSRGGDTMHITVTDQVSHLRVMEMYLTAEQFLNVMTARETADGVPAWFTPVPDRIGQHPASVSRTLQRADLTDDAHLTRWVEDVRKFRVLADVADIRHKGGASGAVEVVFKSWFRTEQHVETWKRESQRLLDDARTPAQLRERANEFRK